MTNTSNDSFLHEAQKLGQANGEITRELWEDAVENINRITKPEALEELGDKLKDPKTLPTVQLTSYCHNCRKIVIPSPRKVGKKMRNFCGECGGAKVASGQEEALKKFYHID